MNESYNSRFFNSLQLTNNGLTVKKTSHKTDILQSEILWYIQLPSSLHIYMPRVHGYSLGSNNMYVELERISSPTLSQLYLKKDNVNWDHVGEAVQAMLSDFQQYQMPLDKEQIHSMYWDKTINRLTEYLQKNLLVHRGSHVKKALKINGKSYPNPLLLLMENQNYLLDLLNTNSGAIIHGDLCFSNIFYDDQTRRIKVIDPRGSFGKLTPYGDPRYDLAKLRHSLSGYDLLIHNRFDVQTTSTCIEYQLHTTEKQVGIHDVLADILQLNDKKVRLIEALLFLSMIPLHQDFPQRQWVMYGLGTELLYQLLQDGQ
ncbi:aminoglycoside phosphotransferase family protein [Fictibacillus sp. KIGAM418]|uniref:Aminoglycoside phosphotransferase family protein n=1 Tax=Fictibacillus marinisediminis TaxID=2878389 RepID=A0A9X2BF74_9BACL|nr:aminoglycoside phosphotransferase family protein [Fictibacillus marinisediminis]MCK6259421.1 aminoglycoside phosphotransferase family protein [Fictibacillus marinisediminis]